MKLLLGALAALCLASLAVGLDNPYVRVHPWTALFLLSAACLARVILRRRSEGRALFDEPAHAPLLLVALTAYLATFRWHGGDDIPNSILPFALLRHGTLSMEPFRRLFLVEQSLRDFVVVTSQPLMSVFSIVPGLLALPVALPAVLAGARPEDLLLHNLSKVSGSLICAASVPVVYEMVRGRASHSWAVTMALFYGLGTWTFSVSSQALHSHGPAQLGVALGLLGMLREPRSIAPYLSGFGFALATTCREDSVFFLAAAALFYLFHRRERLPRFCAGAMAPLALNAAYWLYYTGRLRPPYMGVQGGLFGAFQWEALFAMLASPTRGLFLFVPAAVFGIWGMKRACLDPRRRWAPYLIGACFATLVFYCFRSSWTGGQTFGTRYFAAVCIVLALFCGEIEAEIAGSGRAKVLWTAAFSVSILVHSVGAFFTYPGSYAIVEQTAELWEWSLHPLLNLFRADGPLFKLSTVPRAFLASALLMLTVPLAFLNHRFLSK
ncbi:MAG: hypothetical protein ABII00_13780 [Elusimicrobiota bacterium]